MLQQEEDMNLYTFNKVSWYEGVYHIVSVEAKWVSRPWQVYIKDSVTVGKRTEI